MASFTVTSEPEVNKSPSAVPLGPSTPGGQQTKLQINAAPWTPNAHANAIQNQAQAQQGSHGAGMQQLRTALCPVFMAQGSCPDHPCAYAHSVDELDHASQINLMAMLNGMGSPAGGWGHGQAASGWRNVGGYGRGSHFAMVDDSLDDLGHGPSSRRIPGRINGNPSHNTSASSLGGNPAKAAAPGPQCPPSPGSHSSEISSVSNATPDTDGGLTGSSHGGSANTSAIPTQQPVAPGNYGPHTSPFIKSQMYYSQSASKVTLPERCRYPHQTPGTYYDYLNVKRSVTRVEIERKYQSWRDDGYKKALAIDQDKADAMDRLIVDAKNVLCSEKMRAEYDAMLPKSAAQPFSSDASAQQQQQQQQQQQPSFTKASVEQATPAASAPVLPLAPVYSSGGLW